MHLLDEGMKLRLALAGLKCRAGVEQFASVEPMTTGATLPPPANAVEITTGPTIDHLRFWCATGRAIKRTHGVSTGSVVIGMIP